jgi:hypothetical protein
MRIATIILGTAMVLTSGCAFAAEREGSAGSAPAAVAGTSGNAGASSNSSGATTGRTPGDFSETGGHSNHGTSGNNPVGQVAPGTSNAPAGNVQTK